MDLDGGILMALYLVLLRGVNVGGVVLKMDDFRLILDRLRFTGIRTYIQSGNAIVESGRTDIRRMERDIREEIVKEKALDAGVFVRTGEDVRRIASSHPFDTEGNAADLYVTVLGSLPDKEGVKELMGLEGSVERFKVRGDVVYSSYGLGYGKARFTNNELEKKLKTMGTTRNWRTMQKLLGMMEK
jgi:uncharacterized protein (DUF1697 family)